MKRRQFTVVNRSGAVAHAGRVLAVVVLLGPVQGQGPLKVGRGQALHVACEVDERLQARLDLAVVVHQAQRALHRGTDVVVGSRTDVAQAPPEEPVGPGVPGRGQRRPQVVLLRRGGACDQRAELLHHHGPVGADGRHAVCQQTVGEPVADAVEAQALPVRHGVAVETMEVRAQIVLVAPTAVVAHRPAADAGDQQRLRVGRAHGAGERLAPVPDLRRLGRLQTIQLVPVVEPGQ